MGWGIIGDVVDAAGDVAGDVVDTVGDAVGDAADAVEDIIDATGDAVGDAVDAVGDAMSEAIEAVGDAASDAIDAVEDAVEDALGALDKAASDTWGAVEDAWDHVVDAAEDAWEAVANAADDAWDIVADGAEDAWEAAASAAEDAWETMEASASEAWDILAEGAETAWDRIDAIAEAGIDEISKAYEWAMETAEQAIEWLGGLFVELAELIVQLGACLAGQIVYRVAKAATVIANIGKMPKLLSPDFQSEMRTVFSGASFSPVVYVDDATLSANWFGNGTDGMTFAGVTIVGLTLNTVIYLDRTWNETNDDDRKLMAHELVHVLQYRRFLTEPAFACAYGIGFAQGGFKYRSNPLEAEAYDFVAANSAAIVK